MCMIVLAVDQHPAFSLVLAANRDEYHDRPTAPMHWWSRDHKVLAGQDLRSGGTWLAIEPAGTLALVTNYRGGKIDPALRSRGHLPLTVLQGGIDAHDIGRVHAERDDYGAFNLLAFDGHHWFYSGSEDNRPYRRLYRGIHGLSNHLLQTPWPKVERGRQAMAQSLARYGGQVGTLHQDLLDAMRDDRPADDHLLPDTGVGIATERMLSPPFIKGDRYGTRATTIVTRSRDGQIEVSEQSYGANGEAGERQHFSWHVHKARASETGLL